MTYYEIHRLSRSGQSISKISQYLGLNRRTVTKYLSMSDQEYEAFLTQQSNRQKILMSYESFVKERLEKFRDTSAAQMHDWLKEYYPDLPKVSQKTVFNFVSWVREKHQLPIIKTERQYQQVEETAYGKQAQVDFGEYNMRTASGTRVKVFFFTFLLSRSRYKFIWFTDRYFTTELAIQAHEKAFMFCGGITNEIVYDQDKVFIVSENGGDIILTDAFRAYTKAHSFSLHFCRKSDPESKGKVENLVKYVKRNFLYNRTFHNIETLNDEVLAWLGRTANALPHAATQKIPYDEWVIEVDFLAPYHPGQMPAPSLLTYTVRKNNTISYKGNFYSLPLGTYQGKGTIVAIKVEEPFLVLLTPDGEQEICRHRIPAGKGNKVMNTDHKRDKSTAINEMSHQVASLFTDKQKAQEWLDMIRRDKPRYIRDQLLIIKAAAIHCAPEELNRTLEYCFLNKICSASDFKSLLFYEENQSKQAKVVRLNPLSGQLPEGACIEPQKSSITEYQHILTKS